VHKIIFEQNLIQEGKSSNIFFNDLRQDILILVYLKVN